MATDRTFSALAHVNDIVPTLLEVAGIQPHDGTYRGQNVERLAGHSMLPLMRGQAASIRPADEPLGYELAGSAALFKGDFKLVRNIAPLGDGQWRLYDLKADPGEVNDLGRAQPDRFRTMLSDYADYARANGVLPIPDGFDLQKTAMRFAVTHFVVPKIMAVWPWLLAAAALVLGGFAIRRRARST